MRHELRPTAKRTRAGPRTAACRLSACTGAIAIGLATVGHAQQPPPATQPGVAVPYLPSFANSGFVAAVKARPAGAEFRATAGIAPMTDASAAPATETSASTPATVVSTPALSRQKRLLGRLLDRRRAAGSNAAVPNAAPKVDAPPSAAAMSDAPAPSVAASGNDGWPRLTGAALNRSRTQWSSADVVLAKARCAHILRGLDAVTVPVGALREGECGAPAPVRLLSVGRKPQVTLSPPPLLTCDMVVAVHDWMKKDVQPAARKILRSEITQIEVMSDYSCRNAYGRAHTRLSQHGHANALDVRGFATAKGETVSVLDDWGLTGRQIAALHARQRQIAQSRARKSQSGHAVAERSTLTPRAVAERPAATLRPTAVADQDTPRAPTAASGATAAAVSAAGALTRSTIVDGISRARIGIGGTADASPGEALGLGMSRLGGPKPVTTSFEPARGAKASVVSLPPDAVPAGADPRKSRFLRQIHASGCGIFGTVLGPEANNAHRNHLHIDMAARATGAFCE